LIEGFRERILNELKKNRSETIEELDGQIVFEDGPRTQK